MRRLCVALLLLALTGLAGCRSKVLFIASTDGEQAVTREALFAFRERLGESRAHDAAVELYEMKWHERTSPVLRAEFGDMARVEALSSRAKAVVCLGEPAIREVAAKLGATEITFIACGMKAAPAEYGFDVRHNVIGIFSHPNLLTCMRQIQRMVPNAQRLGILGDGGPVTSSLVAEADVLQQPPMTVSAVKIAGTQLEWIAAIAQLQQTSDAILVAGMESVVADDGQPASVVGLARITGESSRVPTLGLRRDAAMEGGLMAAYAASSSGLGRLSAQYVLRLLNREPVREITPRFAEPICHLYVNTTVAERLGVQIPPAVLRSAAGVVGAAPPAAE